MAGSLVDDGARSYVQPGTMAVTGTGDPLQDGARVGKVVLYDPATGLAMVPGSVTFTTLTIADGSDVAQGAKADAAYTSGSGSLVSLLKGLFARLAKGAATAANSLSVGIASDQIGTAGTAAAAVLSVQGIAGGTTLPVTTAISGGTPTEAIVAVQTTSTSVLPANAARKGLVLQNVGANPITVKLAGGTAVALAGLVLNPQASATLGGDRATFGNNLVPASAITAITVTGATNLYVAEF